MFKTTLSPAAVRRIRRRYEQLKNQLLGLGWISQGSLMHEPPNAWRWTRKIKAKTITVALSQQQAELYQQAIANHRRLEQLLSQMRDLSQKVLLGSVQGVRRRPRKLHPKTPLS
jgi:uncharacterized protein DUF6788